MTLTFGPVACHDDGETVFSPTDLPWRRLGYLDSLLVDARISCLAFKMVVGNIMNVLWGRRTRLGARTVEELGVERVS